MAKVPLSEKDIDGKPIDTTSMQYQELVKACQDQSNKDRKACFTMLYCMHGDLIESLRLVPLPKTCGTNLGSGSARHQ